MNPLLLCGLTGSSAAGAVLWPYRRIRCRMCLGVAWIAMVAGSVAAYDQLGSARLLPKLLVSASLDREMHARLEAHMRTVASHPDDATEWRGFGRDLMIAGRYGEAAAAYEQAFRHDDAADTLFDALTAHYLSAGGEVDDSALPLLETARRRFPGLPKTRYYEALREKTLQHPAIARHMLLALQPEVPRSDPLFVLIAAEIARLPAS